MATIAGLGAIKMGIGIATAITPIGWVAAAAGGIYLLGKKLSK